MYFVCRTMKLEVPSYILLLNRDAIYLTSFANIRITFLWE